MKFRRMGSNRTLPPLFIRRRAAERGSILVYIVMTMVIFGLLGALMVSLFSTSISSSATPNDTRRAFYFYESGVRYAASELINNAPDFSSTTINRLNSNTYKIDPAGSFTLKVFGLNFQSLSKLNPGTDLNLKLDKGLLPSSFTIPKTAPYIYVVNYQADDLGNLSTDQESAIIDFTYQDATHVSLSLADDFVVGERETVAFAVRPFQDDNINQGGALLLTRNAVSLFPLKNGVIVVNGKPYFYDDRIDSENLNYAKLTNIQSDPKIINPFPLVVTAASTYVILSPAIHIITAEGKSGEVTYTEKWYNQYGGSVYDRQDALRVSPESRKWDIAFEDEAFLNTTVGGPNAPSNPTYITADNVDKRIAINGSSGFGATWFRDTRPIGGNRDFCQSGECFFKTGFRAFFIFNFTGASGDGFTLSVLNGSNNDNSSVGGDIDLSELLGYAGDSRTTSNPTSASDFLDGLRGGLGLQAPKMAVEFDGKRNNQNQTICNATTVNPGSRFDPDFSGADRDTVQYVFWGRDDLLSGAQCRINPLTGTNKTYDDNRHDSVNAIWIYDSGSRILSSPAIDNTDPIRIYTGLSSEDTLPNGDGGKLIRLNPSDGTAVWTRNPDTTPSNDDDINSAPALDTSGNIYIGNDNNLLSKYSPGGTKGSSISLDGDIEGKPAVSVDAGKPPIAQDTVYVVTDNGSLFALTKNLAPKWKDAFNNPVPFDIGPAGSTYTSWPVIRYDSVLMKNIVYVGSLNQRLYAVRDDGSSGAQLFSILTGGAIRGTPTINPVSEDIYFGSDDNQIRAFTSQGVFRWSATPSPQADIVSSPAVTSDGGTVYVGSTNGRLYALNALNGSENWKYPDPVRTPGDPSQIGEVRGDPVIGSDGAIYFGSDDGHLYALNPNGTLRFKYPATGSPIGAVRSKPAIGPDGIIYFGANDGKFYAINPAANDPPNIQNLYLTSAELGASVSDVNNWFAEGPWAVRVEVQRENIDSNGDGKFTYTLKTWLKKCQDANCLQDANGLPVVGGFFQNTRFEYDWTTAGITPMTQVIELSNTPDSFHDRFDRFLFGFTSASAASQTIDIRKFQLSFIRSNDPVLSD